MSKEVFLVDANTFIEPYKTYYPFDLAPTFWDFVKLNIENGNIAVLSKVFDEVDKGGDSLSDWLQKLVFAKIDHRTQDVREVYKQIMSHIQNSKSQTGTELYNDKALQEWADNNRADAWLVATGKAKGYTIITFEKQNGSLGTSTCAHAKIPDVASNFGVKCRSLYDMMRALGFAFR